MLCQTCQSIFDAAERRISRRGNPDFFELSHHKSYEDLTHSAQQHCYICHDTLNALSEYYPNLTDFRLETLLLCANIWKSPNDDYNITIALDDIQRTRSPFKTRRGTNVTEISLIRVPKKPALIPISLGNNTHINSCGAIVDHWLSQCTQTHSTCGVLGQPNWYPTRLLDLGNPPEDHGSCIRIFDTDLHDLEKPYLTLSHCWGSADIPKLTAKQSSPIISIDELPKTFKDAISIANFLGIPYLWIDSLCIRQDSKEDWEKEAALMNKVYENAFCNIAATASRDSHSGLFYKRDPIAIEPCQFVFKNQVFQLVSEGHWKYGIDYAPLNKRGWVVQERWFSPRIIYFGREQLFWECNEIVACESFPHGPPMFEDLPIYGNFKSRLGDPTLQERASLDIPIASLKEEPTRVWRRLVRQYSNSTLTVKSDKIVAISRLASAIQGHTKDEYLAGLWRRDIIPQLAWQTDHGWPEKSLNRLEPECYTAPSWSWASVSTPVSIQLPQDFQSIAGYREVSTLIDYGVDLKGTTVTGGVCGGFLRLQGPLRRVSAISSHAGTRRTYLATDGRTPLRQSVRLDAELDDHVMDLFFLCLYIFSRDLKSDVSEADDNPEVIDDHSKDAGYGSNDVGDNSEGVCYDSEDAASGSEDENHCPGDKGDDLGSTGDGWANRAVSVWDTSNDSEIRCNGWDDTVDIEATGLLLRPVPGEIGKFCRVGFCGLGGTWNYWRFSAPKPDAHLSSVDFLPGVGYTITII